MAKKLLLADDSITIQKVVGITFAQEDFDITYVDNGVDAINKAKELHPDIILADIVMPQKTGYDVCEAIKNDAELKGIPILLLAGTFETFDVNRGKTVGADDYIIKPFESQALIDKVNHLLAGEAQQPSAEPEEVSAVEPQAVEPPTQPPSVAAESEGVAFDLQADVDATQAEGLDDLSMPEPTVSAPEPAQPLEPEPLAAEPMDAESMAPPPSDTPMEPAFDVTTVESASPVTEAPSFAEPPAMDEFGLGTIDEPLAADAVATPVSQGEEPLAVEPEGTAADFADVAAELPTESGAAASDVDLLDLPPLPEDTLEAAETSTPAAEAALPSAAISEAEIHRLIDEKVRAVVEKIAWEIIPDLAERLIKEEIERLTRDDNN